MPTTAIALLTRTRELIAAPNGWGQHEFAFDEQGATVHVEYSGACTFCVSGALARANFEIGFATEAFVCARLRLAQAAYKLGYVDAPVCDTDHNDKAVIVIDTNDQRIATQEEAIAWVDVALRLDKGI